MKYRFYPAMFATTIMLVITYIVVARPLKSATTDTPKVPVTAATKQQQPSRYDKILTRYLVNIDKIAARKTDRNIRYEQEKKQSRLRAAEQLKINEIKTLDELISWGKQNVGNGQSEQHFVADKIIAESDASARIFSTLIDEQLIDTRIVLLSLSSQRTMLSDSWVNVIKKIAANTRIGTDIHVHCAYLLYRSGIDQSQYKQEMEDWVLGSEKLRSLEIMKALLFETDWSSDDVRAINTLENNKLVQTILQRNDDPEERFVCAEYLYALGDHVKAESICTELLSRRYKGFDDVDQHPGPEEDGPLYRARTYALNFMFYKLRSEKALKVIYDLSRRPDDEEIKADKGIMPEYGVIYDAYSTARLEVGQAKSLIATVSNDEKW